MHPSKVRGLRVAKDCPPFRVNPNPSFDVLDAVNPYGKRRSLVPWTNKLKYKSSSVLGLEDTEETMQLLLCTSPIFIEGQTAIFPNLGSFPEKNGRRHKEQYLHFSLGPPNPNADLDL